MYNKILIPIDMAHTEKAAGMIAAAKAIANEGATYVLTNIVPAVQAFAEMAVPPEIFEQALAEAEKSLEIIAQENGIISENVVQQGNPGSDILTISDEMGCDLIIIGSHKPGFQDYLLGSTAARIVRHSKLPVLVMR